MRNKIFILILSLCTSLSLLAQGIKEGLGGKVVDRWGNPISGALVQNLENPLIKTSTDVNGKFQLEVTVGSKISITASELLQKVVEVNKVPEDATIVMDYASQLMDLGFGFNQTLSESTGAISRVDAKDIDKRSASSLANSLFGNALGLTALQNADLAWGTPARFSIRGLQTLSNNDILILVDGFERPINTLTVEEVESVSVLRDAAAVALYGYRGVNGVLSVKTKRGKVQTKEINVNYDHAFTSQVRLPKFANSFDYANALNEALSNDGLSARYNQYELDAFKNGTYPSFYPNVNWIDEVFKDHGASDIYNISFRGGGTRMKYYTALNLQSNSGFINNADANSDYSAQMKFSKANIRTNLDIELSSTTRLEIGMQGLLSEFNRPGLNSDGLMDKLYTVPSAAYPTKTYDGIWGGNSTWGSNTNPLALVQSRGFSKGHNRALYADAKLIQDLDFITKGLKASVRLGYDNLAAYWEGTTKSYQWASDVVNMSDGIPRDTVRTSGGSVSTMSYSSSLDYQNRHLNLVANVDYSKSFATSKLFASLIYSYEKTVANNRYNTNYRQNVAGYVHYTLKDKYIADLALVLSGSNRLAPKHKYALAPTLSAAWVVSNENFMKDVTAVDFLKLRASAGIINADFIPTNDYWSQNFVSGSGYPLGNNASWYDGTREGQLPTENIKNERAFKYNVGVDASFLQSIVFSADAFYERRDNIFVSAGNNVSAVLGNYSAYANAGIVDSRGLEFGASIDKKIRDFTFNLGGKFTISKNEIKEQLEESRPYDYLKRTGHSVGQIFGLQAIGFFIDDADIANSPSQEFSTVKPGDIKYKDQNGDGIINDYDMVAIGYNTSVPEVYFSFDFGVEWKNIGISGSFQGVGNYSVMLNTKSIYKPLVDNTSISTHYYENRWTPATAATAKYPRLTTQSNDNNYRDNTVWLADASFLKLRNCEVYYKFPKEILSKVKMRSARLYVRGVDLLTIDKIDISDPESTGVAYPLTKSINVGFAVGF